MKKIFNLLITVFTAMFLFLSFNIDVHADELSFAVAPSKIVNLVIEPGTKEVLTFKVGNRSVFPSHQVEKNELYNFEIMVEGKMFEADGTEIPSKDIIKVSDEVLRCKPNQSASVDVTIDIPRDFEKNSYEISVIFTRMPIAGIEDTSSTNAITSIKVPVYLGVGDPSEYANLKTDFEVEEFKIDLGEEKSIFKYVLGYLKKLITLNPVKVVDTFKSISEKDVYVIKKGDSLVIDTLSDIFTNLETVIVDNEKKMDKKHYVLATKEDYKKAVRNVYFEEKLVRFQLEENTTIEIKCENRVRDNIRAQINTLMKEYELKSPEFEFFVKNLKVPKNNSYNIPQYNVHTTLKNTGEKETFITSQMVLKKDSTTEVGNAKIELVTLQKNNVVEIKVPLELTTDFSSGTYNLYASFVDVKNVTRNANFKFDVNLNLDTQIFIITLIVYIIILALIIILIIILLMRLRDKKGLIGYVIKNNIEYKDIEQTEENFELYKDILVIEDITELENFKLVNSIDVIVRDKADSENSKVIATLQKNSIIQILDDNIDSDDLDWIQIKFNKKMINNKN